MSLPIISQAKTYFLNNDMVWCQIVKLNYLYFTHKTKGCNCTSKKEQPLLLSRSGEHIPIHPLIASSRSQTSIIVLIMVPRICAIMHPTTCIWESPPHAISYNFSIKNFISRNSWLEWCHFVTFVSFVLHLYKKRLEVHVKENIQLLWLTQNGKHVLIHPLHQFDHKHRALMWLWFQGSPSTCHRPQQLKQRHVSMMMTSSTVTLWQ